MRLSLAAIIIAGSATSAFAQGAVHQQGPFTAGHLPMIIGNGAIMDAGGSPGPGLAPINNVNAGTLPTGLGIVNSGLGYCGFTGYASAAYGSECWGFDGAGNGLIDFENPGKTFNIKINGTTYPFPGPGTGDVLGPNSATADNLMASNGTTGKLLEDSGMALAAVPSGRIVGYVPIGFTIGNRYSFATPPTVTIGAGGTTAGLAEALSAGNTNGLSYDIFGNGGTPSTGAFAISTNGGIGVAFPTLRNQYFKLHGASIYGTVGGTDVASLDSMVEADFDVSGGQIGMSPTLSGTYTDATILVDAHTALPHEGFSGILASHLRFGNVSRESVGTATIRMKVANGSIGNSIIEALEANGSGSAKTALSSNVVQIDSPSASTGFLNNYVHFGYVHLGTSVGFQEGLGVTNAANIRNNTYQLDEVQPANSGSTATGISAYGQYNNWTANVDNGASPSTATLFACMTLQASAKYNRIHLNCSDLNGAGNTAGVVLGSGADYNTIELNTFGTVTTPINDVSAGHNSYRINGQIFQEWKNGQQYNYQTPTSVSAGVLLSGSGNSEGTISINAGTPAAVTLTFSITYLQNVTCAAQVGNQVNMFAVVTSAPSKTSVTFTGYNGSGAATNFPTTSFITYHCWGQGN